ncbi:MAG: hypothetical protein IPK26_16835 [Planctomycetes bacterium]|nr:hypothetical protein [Planctomycetota bacterium]
MRRNAIAVALGFAAVSLVGLGTAVVLGSFAAGGWLFLPLVVPCTVGLPTTAAALGIVWVWPGGALPALIITCLLAGTSAQFAAAALWRRWRK